MKERRGTDYDPPAMGAVGLAAWIAMLLFPALLIVGALRGDIGRMGLVAFLVLGLIVWVALPRLVPFGAAYVTPALAVLDIALVFTVFKGDVRM